MNNENKGNRAKFTQCDSYGVNTAEQGGMPCGTLHRAEGFGHPQTEDLRLTERPLYGGGTENRKAKTDTLAEETTSGLFEDIGEYFHIREQVEQVEDEDTAGSLERFADREEGIQAHGHTRLSLYEKDVCKSFER